ncbi:DUF6020 family protein [Vagococcus sp. JNUCC 83]
MSKLKYFVNSIILVVGLNFTFTQGQSFLVSLKNSLMENATLLNAATILLFYFLYKNRHFIEKEHCSIIQWCVSLFLALNQLFRVAISSTGGLTIVYGSISAIVISLIILYTYTYLFNIAQLFVGAFIRKQTNIEVPKPEEGFLKKIGSNHPFITTFIIVLICWLPVIIINYPSILVVDSFRQLKQYYGEIPITNAHPPIHTIMLGLTVSLGRKLGDASLGLFLSNIPQLLMTLFGFSLTSLTIKKMKLPTFYVWINIFIGAFSPAILGMLLVTTKDIFFTSSLLVLYNIAILYYIDKNKTTVTQILYGISFIVMATLVILFRKNGIYMMFPLVIIFGIKLLFDCVLSVKYHQIKKMLPTLILMIVLIVPIVTSQLIDRSLEKKYNMVEDVRKSEMLSIPFQQTARYVKKFPDEVTKDEKDKIKAVMYYDGLGELYNPIISDAVKRTTPKDVTNQELKDYFKVWFQMFLKHPITYVESTAAQNYYLFSPENYNYYYSTLTYGYDVQQKKEGETYIALMNKLGIKKTESKKGVQKMLTACYRLVDSLPILGLLSSFSFGVIVLLVLFALSIRYRLNVGILAILPMLMLLLTIFAGPVIRGYLRYGLPFVYVMPIIFCFTIYLYREKNIASS